jgi:hypothetical protein
MELIPPKYWHLFTRLHGVMPLTTVVQLLKKLMIHMSPSLNHILSQMNLIHALVYSFNIHYDTVPPPKPTSSN